MSYIRSLYGKTRVFLLSINDEIGFTNYLPKLFILFSILVFVSTLLSIAPNLFNASTPRGITVAFSNDAGRAIQTSQLSNWYSSNHFAPYGNLYFRISNSIASLTEVHPKNDLKQIEELEVRHHYSLLLTSLFSLSALCLFLAYVVTQNIGFTFLFATLLLRLSLFDTTWVEYLFVAHPDHMLMLATAYAAYETLRYTVEPSRKNFILSAFGWGIATGVKRSTALMVPSFLYLFLSEGLNKKSLLKGLRFIGYMLLAYLVVGFPQNFGFYKHIKFLISESQNVRPATIESITRYASLLFDQTKFLLLALLPTSVLIGRFRYFSAKFLVFVFVAIVFAFSRKMVFLYDTHHMMPLASLVFISFISIVSKLPKVSFKYQNVLWGVAVLLTLYILPKSPAFSERIELQRVCRMEAEQVLNKVKELQATSNGLLVRDPFFPFDSSNKRTKQIWGSSFQDLDSHDADYFGTTREFSKQFLLSGPLYNMNEKAKNWKDKTELYSQVLKAESFTTPQNRVYKKIIDDKCGFMLWEKDS